jgi:hypothetical protein
MDDAAKAAKRAEIEAKVAAMRNEQKRQEVRTTTRSMRRTSLSAFGCRIRG